MNILDHFFSWLLLTSVHASLLALAVLCIQFALQRWLPARWRYALWLPVILVLLAPKLPTSRFSMQNHLVPGMESAPAKSSIQTPMVLAPAHEATIRKEGHQTVINPIFSEPNKIYLLHTIWLLGTGAMLFSGAIGYWNNLRRIKYTAIDTSEALLKSVTHLAKEINLRGIPGIIVSKGVESPAVTGLLWPTLLLPANFPAGFTETESRLVLLHELMHLKRHDLIVNWLLYLLQMLHWFNPLLWFVFFRMRVDRETACDAQVLAFDSQDHRINYGHALLKLQNARLRFSISHAFVGLFEQGTGIHARIRAIARHHHAHPIWTVTAIILIIGLSILGATQAEPGGASEKEQTFVLLKYQALEVPENFASEIIGQQPNTQNDHLTCVRAPGNFPILINTLFEEKKAACLNSTVNLYSNVLKHGPVFTMTKGPSDQAIQAYVDILAKLVSSDIELDITFHLYRAADWVSTASASLTDVWNGNDDAKKKGTPEALKTAIAALNAAKRDTASTTKGSMEVQAINQSTSQKITEGEIIILAPLIENYVPGKRILIAVSSRTVTVGPKNLTGLKLQIHSVPSPTPDDLHVSESDIACFKNNLHYCSSLVPNRKLPITLDLKENISLASALENAAAAAVGQLFWQENAAVLRVSGINFPSSQHHFMPFLRSGKTAKRASQLTLSHQQFENMDLEEVLRSMANAAGWAIQTNGNEFVFKPPSQ